MLTGFLRRNGLHKVMTIAASMGVLSYMPVAQSQETAEMRESTAAYENADGLPSPLQTPAVLETFEISSGYAFQLEVPACEKKTDKYVGEWTECPIAVNLLKNNKKIDQQFLPVAAAPYEFEKGQISMDWNWSIDLYNAQPELQAWDSGYEQYAVGVLGKAVQLGSNYEGFLVSQLYGFERVLRDHRLYAVEKNRIKEVWSHTEGSPPNDGVIAVYPVTYQGQPFLLFWKRGTDWEGNYDTSTWDHPDYVEARLLYANSKNGRVESILLPTDEIPLYAVVTGRYPDLAKARNAIDDLKCSNYIDLSRKDKSAENPVYIQLQALKTEHYPELSDKKEFVTGDVFFSQEVALRYQQALNQRCEQVPDSTIIRLNKRR